MADEGQQDENESLTPIEFTVLVLILLVFFVFLPLGCTAVGVDQIRDSWANVDTSASCSPESDRCLRRTQGVVEVPESPYEVGLRYDDGRRHLGTDFEDGWRPELGTRVLLERFRGEVVSVYDPGSERRHKTDAWPSKADAVAAAFFVVLAVVFLGLGVYALGHLLLSPLLSRWS